MPARKFIPALRFKVLTPLIDPVLNLFMKGGHLKSLLVSQLNLKDNESLLDFGCGTGTLAVMIKKARPGCAVTGIDVDPQVLEIAREKARHGHGNIYYVEYDGVTLPFADESFDKVVTSLVLHHLSTGEKHAALKEILRALKKGGELHIMDFGVQRSGYAKMASSILKYLEPIEDNIRGKIPEYLVATGFENVKETGSVNALFGSISFYISKRPQERLPFKPSNENRHQ